MGEKTKALPFFFSFFYRARIRRRPSDLTRLGSVKNMNGDRDRIEALVSLISERDAAISALEFEVQRLSNEVQKQTKVGWSIDNGSGLEISEGGVRVERERG